VEQRSDLDVETSVLDELDGRGLLASTTDRPALCAEMDGGPMTFYVGFDPTAPSLHIGNLLQLLTARRLQAAGHRPLILVGGATGLIGDPKEAGERVLNSPEVVAGWVERIREQVGRFVELGGHRAAQVVDNLDWTASLGVIDFLRDVGKHFPVNRMLGREVVRSRLDAGISYTEFSYVLLQAMDYLELFRRHGCRLQTGGSDQWGNITAGVELVRRTEGVRVHAIATPLVTKADGTKFGKTETGTVWLDPELTSPYAFHQFWVNAEDAMAGEYLRLFTFRSLEEIVSWAALHEFEALEVAAWPDLGEGRAEYERTAATYGADAWMCGRITMEPFAGGVRAADDAAGAATPAPPPRVDFVAPQRP
jgi:tyrosyl-tRNA synthetase